MEPTTPRFLDHTLKLFEFIPSPDSIPSLFMFFVGVAIAFAVAILFWRSNKFLGFISFCILGLFCIDRIEELAACTITVLFAWLFFFKLFIGGIKSTWKES